MSSEIINKKEEYIVCAAIHFRDKNKYEHQPKNIKSGMVICGLRHCNCFTILNEIEIYKIHYYITIDVITVQGFLTSQNRFVNRKDALKIALNSKQIKEHIMSDELDSSDLY